MSGLAAALATMFGAGRFPIAPGTAGSAIAFPLAWFLLYFWNWPALLFFSLAVIGVGVWACDRYARDTGIKDPSECVIDEVAGQCLAMLSLAPLGLLFDWKACLAAFVLFRLLDMFKPWPIYRFERIEGGVGIMADDIVAGMVAAVLIVGAAELGWL